MSCIHDCEHVPAFPPPIFNRPGLERIDYRIGGYAELRRHILARIDAAPALAAWTHRKSDDPAIALVESAAIVADILTFYETLYANEVFLRTARWRESVAELVKLLGYRIAPGLGSEATVAVTVKGDAAIGVPKGFGFKAQLEGRDKPVVFESTAAVTAHPHLGAFHLYRPHSTPLIANGSTRFEVISAPAGVRLRPGDRLMVGIAGSSGKLEELKPSQIVIVDRVWESFGSTLIAIKGSITCLEGTASTLAALKIGSSHQLFGHNAPATMVEIADDGTAATVDVPFFTAVRQTLALEGVQESVTAGATVIVELPGTDGGRTVVRSIASVATRDTELGSLTGPSTFITLTANASDASFLFDIRRVNVHVAVGSGFMLRAEPVGAGAQTGSRVAYFGTGTEFAALAKRSLLLTGPDGVDARRVVALDAVGVADEQRLRTLTLDRDVAYRGLDDDDPKITVYGNLVPTTQGKTENEAVLGDGDGRQIFQTFPLPKQPLTYLLAPGESPQQHAELDVWVDGIRWQRVDSFFGAKPHDQVFVVREDAADKSYVQFGDGKTGARLSSGHGNVVARYRTGTGANGPVKPGTKPQPDGRLTNLDQVRLPLPAVGGAEAESAASARTAAPGRMQSLGRLVGLADFEAEAQSVPGVLKARATWMAGAYGARVRVTVLTASEDPADAAKVTDTLRALARTVGPRRFALEVVQGRRLHIRITLVAGYDARHREEDVRRVILEALGARGEEANGIRSDRGLFSIARRQFGQSAHSSQISGAVQQASGVAWVTLRYADFPSPPSAPALPLLYNSLLCPTDRILALDAADLNVSLVRTDREETA